MWHLGNVPECEGLVFLSNVPTACLIAKPADSALQHSGEKQKKLVVNLLRAGKHWSVCIQLANGQEKFSEESIFSLLSCLSLP